MYRTFVLSLLACASMALCADPAAAGGIVRQESNPLALIHPAVTVGPGTTLIFVSGQVADPKVLPQSPGSPSGAIDLGDTKAQTISALSKIESILAKQGFKISDIVKLTVYLVGDPALGGRMDFDGMNAGFRQFFRTPENPSTVARSTVQVAGLAGAAYLVEIEAIAAK